MIDQFGRSIEYLRLSLTERCTLRCVYCRKDEGICPKAAELSCDEFFRIAKVCVELGINRIRLTGGEPLLRKDIIEIVKKLSTISGVEELTMTSNGQMLAEKAASLKQAGLTRINISIDSLDPKKYNEITGGDLNAVLAGINEAVKVGLLPVKLNMVLVKGMNDQEVDDLIALSKDRPIDVRIIELMPMAEFGQDRSLVMNNDDLIAARPYLKPIAPRYVGQPSRDYSVDGYLGRVGFISPMYHRFCSTCNRVRVMSDGMLRACLGDNTEVSLKEALQNNDAVLKETIQNAIYKKPAGHHFETGFEPQKSMARIGG
ncbi:MAG: GTP 3',8-cyclase MoaA [Anaerolineaceae bacterium]